MVRQLAQSPPTPVADRGSDAYIMIVIDTLAGEVDAYGPMPLAQAHLAMRRLRVDLEADGTEFGGVAIRILALRHGVPRRMRP